MLISQSNENICSVAKVFESSIQCWYWIRRGKPPAKIKIWFVFIKLNFGRVCSFFPSRASRRFLWNSLGRQICPRQSKLIFKLDIIIGTRSTHSFFQWNFNHLRLLLLSFRLFLSAFSSMLFAWKMCDDRNRESERERRCKQQTTCKHSSSNKQQLYKLKDIPRWNQNGSTIV